MVPGMNRSRAALLLLLISTALLAAGCGSSSSSDSTSATDTGSTSSTSTGTTTDSTSADTGGRDAIIAGISSTLLGHGLPADYTSCVLDKARNQVTDSQYADLIKRYAAGDTGAAKQFGVKLGTECVSEGAGIASFRASFVSSIRSGLKTANLSPAYKACVLKGATTDISDQQLAAILILEVNDPAAGQKKGQAIGRSLGLKCVAQGVTP